MEISSDLVEYPYPRQYVKKLLHERRGFVSTNQTRTIYNSSMFEKIYKDGFWQILYTYEAKDEYFEFIEMDESAQNRFIGLLAPLTLHYFSKTSKVIYYSCLDMRGIEFTSFTIGPPHVHVLNIWSWFVELDPYQGRLDNRPKNKAFGHYCAYYGSLHANIEVLQDFLRKPEYLRNGMKYKSLLCRISFVPFGSEGANMWKTLMHPGLEHLKLELDLDWSDVFPMDELVLVFGYCKNVITFCFVTHTCTSFILAELKTMIENWSFSTKRLEFFQLEYEYPTRASDYYVIHNNKLKKCVVVIENQWFVTEDFNFPATEKVGSEHFRYYLKVHLCPHYYKHTCNLDVLVEELLKIEGV